MTQATLAFEDAAATAWDAIVLGAGPAGALAARQLAIGGARVLLVDKKAFPRWKVCGACLNGRALAVLDAVGLGSLVEGLGGIALDAVELRLAGRSVRLPLPSGVALSRTRMDAALIGAAVDAGAEFLPETQGLVEAVAAGTRRVRLAHRGRATEAGARVVLVAAGLGQTCLIHDPASRTRVARRSRVGAGCVLEDVPDFYQRKTILMAVAREAYVGMVRVEDGGLNVAAAFERDFVRRSGSPGDAAAAVLAEAGLPPIAALRGAAWQGTVGLTRRTSPIAGDRLFVLGDAAGYVEPFTGEGMAWALASGRAVAPLALRGIARWEPAVEQAWPKVHRRLVGRRQRLCRGVAALLHHPWLSRAAFEMVARAPGTARLIVHSLNAPPVLPKVS